MSYRYFFYFLVLSSLFSPVINSQNLELKITGKDSIETSIIDSLSYSNKFTDLKSLNLEIDDVIDKLHRKGFIECELIFTRKENDSIFNSKIHLKKRFYTIYIYTNKKSISKSLLNNISNNVTPEYFVIPISKIEGSLNYINTQLANQGDPFIVFKLENISKKDSTNLKADLIIDESSKRTIDKIVVKGYESFPKSFLKHYLKLKTKSDFNLNDINNKVEALNNLSFSKQVKPPEVLFTKDSTNVYLYLEKSKSNSFDGFLGFGTNEGSGKIEFDGYLDLKLINNLNYGESLYLNYKSDENEQRTFNVDIKMPYLFKSLVGASLNLNIFKKDSSFTTTTSKIGLFYQLNSKQKIQVDYNNISSNILVDNISLNLDDFNSKFLTLGYEYIKLNTNDLLFPKNMTLTLNYGIGRRYQNEIKQKQQSYVLEASKIFALNNRNSIFTRINSSGLFSDNYYDNELFRFGGINSIRGFEENSITATLYGVLNTEYRYKLSSNIYINSIIDASYFENKIIDLKEKLYGFGVGLGILTKAGFFRINYANGKSEGQNFNLSNSKIHISLNTIF